MNNTNLILSVILSIAIIVGWQYFYETPRLKSLSQLQRKQLTQKTSLAKQSITNKSEQIIDLADSIQNSPRVAISNGKILGSVNLIGARIDDILLEEYNETVSDNHKVRLLSPSNTEKSYFIELGWHSTDQNLELPNSSTKWTADSDQLTPSKPLTLRWTNTNDIEFIITFKIDNDYMLFSDQIIINKSYQNINLQPYMLINRNYQLDKTDSLLHKGFIGVVNKELHEVDYTELKSYKSFEKPSAKWFGMTDKYWLSAIIPDDYTQTSINLSSVKKQKFNKFQLDIVASPISLKPQESASIKNKIFIGAKKVKLLDEYAKRFDIKLFDRSIDFGRLYIITKPMFYALNVFYSILGNFGLSIIALTVVIKALLFGLTLKAGKSVKKLKTLQPEIEKIKKLHENDKARLNQEIMLLYKRENFNPLSGCLPILIQMPILFAIYKVLYVTIEMRHAPFFGWIQDLSAPDPTSVLTLFNLIPVQLPNFLQIGIWPILMSLSMYIQQKMNSSVATDPVQEQMMKMMPVILLFMLARFPAGLMIYWTWSNILSIAQQAYINKHT